MRYETRPADLKVLEYLEAAGNASKEEMERWTRMDEDDVHGALYRLREEDVIFEYGGEAMLSWRVPDPGKVRKCLSDAGTADIYAFIRDNDDARHPEYGFEGVPMTGIFHEYGVDAVRDPFVAEEGERKIALSERLNDLEEAGLIERKGFNARGSEEKDRDGDTSGVNGLVAGLFSRGREDQEEYRFMEDWGHAGAFYTAADLPAVHDELVADLLGE